MHLAISKISAIILAAGKSSRFGEEKLLHPLDSGPMIAYVAELARSFPFGQRIVVTRRDLPDVDAHCSSPEFDIVYNDTPAHGLGRSLAMGVMATMSDAEAVLILLADMPFVTADHVSRLITAYEPDPGVVASCRLAVAQPPALFGRRHFDTLAQATGDQGARNLLDAARLVDGDPDALRDIDTRADL